MNLIDTLALHIAHGDTPIVVAAVLRLFSLIPLSIVAISITKTFISKLHSINGLRPYRVLMLTILMAAIIDQILFIYFGVLAFFRADGAGEAGYLLFNSSVTFLAYGFLYFLFSHASEKDKNDRFK